MKLRHFLPAATFVLAVFHSQAELLDQVEIVVNNDVVLQSEVDALVTEVKRKSTDENGFSNDAELRKQVRERLIIDSLQYQIAKRMGVRISDAQLDQTLQQVAESEALTVEALQQSVESSGNSWNSYRESIRKELAINEARQATMRRRINISEQEVDAMLSQISQQQGAQQQYRIGHLMAAINDENDALQQAEAERKARQWVEQLKQGASLYALAQAESDGPKALEGGDWGYMAVSEMPTLFAESVRNRKAGDIIGPVRSGSGLHVIQIVDIKGEESVTLTEVQARHILIKPSVVVSEERAQQLLAKYRQQVLDGNANFEDLAKQHSDDSGTALVGGELGWQTTDIYDPAFADALNRLEVGEISAPFRSSFGWHIAQLQGKRSVDVTDRANKQRAYQMLYSRRFNEELTNWLQELRQDAYVEVVAER